MDNRCWKNQMNGNHCWVEKKDFIRLELEASRIRRIWIWRQVRVRYSGKHEEIIKIRSHLVLKGQWEGTIWLKRILAGEYSREAKIKCDTPEYWYLLFIRYLLCWIFNVFHIVLATTLQSGHLFIAFYKFEETETRSLVSHQSHTVMTCGARTQTQAGACVLTQDPTPALWGSEENIWTQEHLRNPRCWVKQDRA